MRLLFQIFTLGMACLLLFNCNAKKEVVNANGETKMLTKKEIKLQDTWILESLKEKPIDKALYREGLPSMELKPADGRMEGFTGCNRMHTNDFKQTTETISFVGIRSTKKACIPDINERTFIIALEACSTYNIKKDKLYLYNKKGREMLVFKKSN